MGKIVAIVAVVAALGAGAFVVLGGDDDSPAPPERTLGDADRAAAREGLIHLTDLPAGWQVGEDDDSQDDFDFAGIEECKDVEAFEDANRSLEVDGESFDRGPETVSSRVDVAADSDTVDEFVDLLEQTARACFDVGFQQAFREEAQKDGGLPEGVTIGDLAVADLPFPSLGERTLAWRVQVPIAGRGIQVNLNADVVTVDIGRAVATYFFMNTGSPTYDAKALTRTAVARLAAAFRSA